MEFRPYQRSERPSASEYAQQWGQGLNNIGQTFMQAAKTRQEMERQAMLDEYIKTKELREQRQFDSTNGTPIDPNTFNVSPFAQSQSIRSSMVPGGQAQAATASPLIGRLNEWIAGGMKANRAEPDFMPALNQDQRKLFQDQNSPKYLAEVDKIQAEADKARRGGGEDKDFYFVETGSGKLFDRNMQPIDMAPVGAVPRILGNPNNSSELTKRSGLVRGGRNSISKVKEFMTPSVVNEMKGIRFTPGKVYSQLGTSEAKRAFSHLKNAISNELYVKSGATANPGELEEKALMYLPAANDSVDDILYRLDMLDGELSLFDSGGGMPTPMPGGGGGGNDDATALQWAMANPNDPRAKEIMRLQGR